jgi:predicted enzyme related to lactoylglutathione lyase
MTCQLHALCFDAKEPLRLARFWAGLLGWEVKDSGQAGDALLPSDDTGFGFRFLQVQEQHLGRDPMHFHLTSSSLEDQQQTVARALELGARHFDAGQRPDEGHVVLADPEGYEFCVIEPGNRWLAGCGFFAEVTCDGSVEAGYFWSAALGWPLVLDEGLQTSIRSPRGGQKISWDDWVLPRTGKSRLHFDLVPSAGDNQQAEADRLISLGATRIDAASGEADRVVMADPDGNEFCLLSPR